ncbi:MAG: hypothetical protein FD126_2613 [Elusimicrobia bacterium]|nr:MAG: hypothetical protein FD126_2613 [Elusimicrobiota bacterium]
MRVRPLLAVMLSAAGLASCASPPLWVRRTPVLRLLYWPWGQLYLENPKFSFEVKRNWKGPELVDGGVRFRAPGSSARVTVNYFLDGAPGWREKKAWRPWLRQQGSTEDTHVVDTVEISSHSAHHVIFTEHEYDPEYLLGAKSAVRKTELTVLPDEQGVFVIRYEGLRGEFEKHRPSYLRFLESLTLAIVDPPPVE